MNLKTRDNRVNKKTIIVRSIIVGCLLLGMAFLFFWLIKSQMIENYLNSLERNTEQITTTIEDILKSEELSLENKTSILKENSAINYQMYRTLYSITLRNSQGETFFATKNPDIFIASSAEEEISDHASNISFVEQQGSESFELEDGILIAKYYYPVTSSNLVSYHIELVFRPYRLANAIFKAKITIFIFLSILLLSLTALSFKLAGFSLKKMERRPSFSIREREDLDSKTNGSNRERHNHRPPETTHRSKEFLEDQESLNDLIFRKEKEQNVRSRRKFLTMDWNIKSSRSSLFKQQLG